MPRRKTTASTSWERLAGNVVHRHDQHSFKRVADEERRLENAVAGSSEGIDFNREP